MRLFNTLTRREEDFVPADGLTVRDVIAELKARIG